MAWKSIKSVQIKRPKKTLEAAIKALSGEKTKKQISKMPPRKSWDYVCWLLPKLANCFHKRVKSQIGHVGDGWYIYNKVTVGKRTAEIGLMLWAHTLKFAKERLKPNEHYIEFYLCFDGNSITCYQVMTNLPEISCGDGYGNEYPVDIPTKRKEIYKYMGI